MIDGLSQNNTYNRLPFFLIGALSGIVSSAACFLFFNARRCGKKKEEREKKTKRTFDNNWASSSIPLPRAGVLLRLESDPDNLFECDGPIKPFQFNYEVVRVFDDMISRSVPFYQESMITLVHWIAAQYSHRRRRNNTQLLIYDLGCSTGTTIDFLAQSLLGSEPTASSKSSDTSGKIFTNKMSFVGVDNSQAMIEMAEKKLSWIAQTNSNSSLSLLQQDILQTEIQDASVVILNYTLQFIPVCKRKQLLMQIFEGLSDESGVLYISEKIRSSNDQFQEICTRLYEDFKIHRGYSKTEIFRKKEALMNVLVPYTEEELIHILIHEIGFDHAQVLVKWNNFTTIVALKTRKKQQPPKTNPSNTTIQTCLESLFYDSATYNNTMYMNMFINEKDTAKTKAAVQCLLNYREEFFQKNLKRAANNYETAAHLLRDLSKTSIFHNKEGASRFWIDTNNKSSGILCIGSSSIGGDASPMVENENGTQQDLVVLNEFLTQMKPWKKGPLQIFGTYIDTEWRSDWKWDRLKKHVDSLDGHVVADLGCANGYFMFRMLHDFQPKLIVGIDPNYKAWLEFLFFQRVVQSDALVFELMDGECMDKFVCMYDTVFCLGVLYHTPDPIGMLRKIHKSMKPKGQLLVDCQGVPGNDAFALFPKDKYANAKGMWFLPTVTTLTHWLARCNFVKIDVFYSEPLSIEEQRATEWARVKSLNEALDDSQTTTVEGYPAPSRFYVKCYRG